MAKELLKKIIIDTDPGIDDAMAILLAAHSNDLELLGLTTVFGNNTVDITTRNACFLLEQFGYPDVPVIAGADRPLDKREVVPVDFIHGADGLGNIGPQTTKTPIETDAASWMVDQIMSQPGEVTLVAVAPLTNLANALQLEPEITAKVKEVVIMGGAINHSGNMSPAAEANIYNDPEAADIVFSANWPMTLMPLDVTEHVILPEARLNSLLETSVPGCKIVCEAANFYRDFYQKLRKIPDVCAHDVAAVAYCLWPDLYEYKEGAIRVLTETIARGMTIQDRRAYWPEKNDWSDRYKVKAARVINAEEVLERYLSTIASAKQD